MKGCTLFDLDFKNVCVCVRARAFSGNLRIIYSQAITRASQVALVVKGLPANAEDVRDVGSIPGTG